MEKKENMPPELRISLEQWAEESLEGIGIFKNKSPEFERLKKHVIDQLRSVYSEGGLPEGDQHCALLAANTLREAVENYRKRKI